MLSACFRLAAAIHGYLAFYMPSNRVVDWLRAPRGLKWAIPVALVAAPTYLNAMKLCVMVVERGGAGWVNVLVLLFAWNAIKFTALGIVASFAGLARRFAGPGS
jgi:hypothetical protein